MEYEIMHKSWICLGARSFPRDINEKEMQVSTGTFYIVSEIVD